MPEAPNGGLNLHLILTVFLGIGMTLFGVVAVYTYAESSNIKRTQAQRIAEAEKQAAAKQKGADELSNRIANQQPFRTFTAEVVDGAFKLQVPKNWSMYYARSSNGQTQVDLMADPNVVVNNLPQQSSQNTHAFRLQLLRKTMQETVKPFSELVKKKQLTNSSVTVSGITGSKFEGILDTQRHNGVVIVLPVRDKTIVLTTEDKTYINEFNAIVEAAKINP